MCMWQLSGGSLAICMCLCPEGIRHTLCGNVSIVVRGSYVHTVSPLTLLATTHKISAW